MTKDDKGAIKGWLGALLFALAAGVSAVRAAVLPGPLVTPP